MSKDRKQELMDSAVFGGEALADSDIPCPKCMAEGKIKGTRQGRYLVGEETGRLFCPIHGVRTYHSDALGAVTIPEDES